MTFPFPAAPMNSMPMMPQNFNIFNKVPMAPPLYIGDLDENIHDETLYDFFSKFGPIHFVRIMKDPATGKSRGFGYVNFIYPRDAESARQYAQYEKLGRKFIRIMFKRNIRDLPPEANVFIKNLDPHVTVKDLHNHFSQVGPILCAKVATNSEGQSLGYGYVQFEKKEDADSSIEHLQSSRLKENEIQLFAFLNKDRRGTTTAKRNIYIKNLPGGKSEAEVDQLVGDLFSKYGEIETKLVKKHPTEDKYSAFICYKDEQSAQKAVTDVNENPKTLEGADGPLYAAWHQGRSERVRELKRLYSQANNNTNLYVKNLRGDVTESEVKSAFQQFGNIVSVAVKDWDQTNPQKQTKFGFIAFDNADDAKRAQTQAASTPEIRGLYAAGVEPYINLHQTKDKRNEFLYTRRRRKMQTGGMNMDAFKGMPFPFANRRFQPFPPMMMQQQHQRPGPKGPRQFQRGPWVKQPHHAGGGKFQQQGPRQGQGQRGPYQNRKHETSPPKQQAQDPHATAAITVQNLRTKLSDFLQLDIEKQRQILGELLFPLVRVHAGEHVAPKITGMLIDLSVLEVSEILEFLENPQLLEERVTEAKALIAEEGL
jgi:polyadenylate-binding protein